MILQGCNIIIKTNKSCLLVFLLLFSGISSAIHVNYVVTGGVLSPPAALPLVIADASLEVISGTFTNGAGGATINLTPANAVVTDPQKNTSGVVLIDLGATVTYTTAGGSTIIGTAATSDGYIINYGTITRGAGTNAINLTTGAAQMNITNFGTITGPVLLGAGMSLYNDGTSAAISGAISGTSTANLIDNIYFGSNSAVNYTTGALITNVTNVNLRAGALSVTNSITNISQNLSIDAGTTFNLSSSLTGLVGPTANLSNSGSMFWGVGSAVSTFSSIQNNNIFRISAASTNNSPIQNNGTMTVNAALTGGGTISNNANSTLILNAGGGTVDHAITTVADSILNVTGPTAVTAAINNSGIMTIYSTLSGATGNITNNSGASITFSTNTNVSNASKIINNNFGANLYVNANSTTAANIINSGTMTIAANLAHGTATLTGNGTVIVSGNARALTGTGTYTNAGKHNSTITNATVFDSLSAGGPIDISGGTVNITSSYLGGGTWDVLTATLAPPTLGTVNIPSNTLLNNWSRSFVGNSLRITSVARSFASFAIGANNTVLAEILDNMLLNSANSQQSALTNAFAHAANQTEFNNALSKLVPNINSVATNIATQNAIFGKIETRIAAAQGDRPMSGFMAGDVSANSATWFGGFGSIAKQGSIINNRGYKARTTGVLMGFDHKKNERNISGFALGMSNTAIDDSISPTFTTHIVGVHGLMYGAKKLRCNRFFEWLGAGAANHNNSSKGLIVGNTDLSTKASYNWYQAALRMNVGKNYDFEDFFRMSPLLMLQYNYIHQPAYDEVGSPAALHVEDTKNKNILTLGAGTKMSFPVDDWWLVGSREFRAMITYDVARTEQITTSRFIIGGPSFTSSNSPAKMAIKFGADLSFEIFHNLQLQVNYDYELRHKYTDHTGMVKLRYIF